VSDKVFWIEQRYVVPVVAENAEEAKHIAFSQRTDIARECGPVWDGSHRSGIGLVMRINDRDGWHGCAPYGRAAGRTVDQWEPEKYGTVTCADKPS
jgi:hypothetical protein